MSWELPEAAKYMLLSTFYFGIMNFCIKMLSHLPPTEIMMFRCSLAMVIALYQCYRMKIDWLGSNRWLLFLRGAFGTVAVYTFFVTIQNMPLASAVTIQYLSPIFTTIVAIFLLNEKVKPLQFLFFAISFAGVLCIKGFDTRIEMKYLIYGIVSAVASAFAYNMVRSLKHKEHEIVVLLHFQILGAVIGAFFCFFTWKMPKGMDWVYLFLTGVFTYLGQLYLTKSLHRSAIANVSILNYVGILYALGFGYFFFGETHGMLTFIGMALVIGGVLMNIFYTNKKAVNEIT